MERCHIILCLGLVISIMGPKGVMLQDGLRVRKNESE